MKKILFVSTRLNENNKNGAYVVSKRNFDVISSISDIDLFIIKEKSKNKILDTFNKRMESIDKKDEEEILRLLKNGDYDCVFYDTSLFGYLVERVKEKFPKVKNIIFCHDISKNLYESIFKEDLTKGVLGVLKKIKRKIFLINIQKNEKKSFKNADKIITLNKRETKLLKESYGYSSSIEIPITIDDKFSFKFENMFDQNKKNIIFVGVANFFPNFEGVKFFMREVLPYIDINLYIIGKNMEKYKEEFEKLSQKVKVLGTVDNLDNYYLSADAVIAPIFSGGGMKVKTAEALMYGKTIFGTKEAFEGYDLDFDKIGGLCNTANEFINQINQFYEKKITLTNENSRESFLRNYSYDVSKKKFAKILNLD